MFFIAKEKENEQTKNKSKAPNGNFIFIIKRNIYKYKELLQVFHIFANSCYLNIRYAQMGYNSLINVQFCLL